MTTVDHLRHPLALTIRSLLTREDRRSLQQMIIDDEENIIQAITAGIKLQHIFATDIDSLSKELREKVPTAVPIIAITKRTSKKIFGNEKISRVFAIAAIKKMPPISHLNKITHDIIVLDKLTISGNVGAIIRTSVALEAGAIVILDSDPIDIYDRRVIRASRGYLFKIPILCINTSDFIQFCHNNDIKLLVTTSKTKTTIDEALRCKEKLAIVFGSEKEGCSVELFAAAGIKARIPINEKVESLNVSAAASIILYLRKSQFFYNKSNAISDGSNSPPNH